MHDAIRRFGLLVGFAVLLIDQFVKWLVTYPLDLEAVRSIPILPFFDLTWVENYGVSMGFLVAGSERERWLLVAITAAIAIAVSIWIWRERERMDVVALGLVLGGAAGNIIDRARLGYVADFLDLHIGSWRPFLVFNVADAAITIGVLLLVTRAFLVRERKPPAENIDAV